MKAAYPESFDFQAFDSTLKEGGYALSKSNVVSIDRAESSRDALTDVLRDGSRRLLREAIEAEVESFLAEYRGEVTEDGCRRMVRNGYLREREI